MLELYLTDEQSQAYEGATNHLHDADVINRIWSMDHTVWSDSPEEIDNRLGWLRIMDTMLEDRNIGRIRQLAEIVGNEGYTDVLLMGMGGSSLAPEVFKKSFGVEEHYLDLHVLDSTNPDMVRAYEAKLDLSKTLCIVATKSGGTAETLSAFKYFYNRILAITGDRSATGAHFVGITDPGSKLETMSDKLEFRAIFLNDPNIGGRYSALSFFGLVPAGLLGVEVGSLLENAQQMAVNCAAANSPSEGDNLGGQVGALIGAMAEAGRDKLTLLLSPQITSFGDWVEQLIAESTGKVGKGILPVVGEPAGDAAVYGDDRVFVYIKLGDDTTYDEAVQDLHAAGHPVAVLKMDSLIDMGGQFFLWEMATSVAGHILQIHPFNQPNVESAKVQARKMIEEYQEKGALPELTAALSGDGMTVYGDVSASSPGEAFSDFVAQAGQGAYISLHAYIHPTEASDAALQTLQKTLRDKTKLATTVGYGPRFLHSTGQLHKGDAGNGIFIQFTSDNEQDVDIPDEAGEDASGMSFGTLITAQSLGDRQALLDEGRKVLRIDLGSDVTGNLAKLTAAL